MKCLKCKRVVEGISIDVNFDKGVSFVENFGKTYLLKLLEKIAIKEGYSCIRIDFSHVSLGIDKIKELCRNKDIVLLDNGDLYLDNVFLAELNKSESVVVVAAAYPTHFDIWQDCITHFIKFDGKALSTEAWDKSDMIKIRYVDTKNNVVNAHPVEKDGVIEVTYKKEVDSDFYTAVLLLDGTVLSNIGFNDIDIEYFQKFTIENADALSEKAKSRGES